MTRCVVFRTPGLIPLEAFTTFGVNAKPNSTNPFGYFGTGLKYAIAVCLRNGCRVVLWRGTDRYEFYVKREDFRGKEFSFVRMKKSRAILGSFAYSKLPFTLELGKNWELWQAFRELETNTRDEGGVSFLATDSEVTDWDYYRNFDMGEMTFICVEGERFVDEFLDMDKHFLVDGETLRLDADVQVIDRHSKHVYYRGVRIMDLKEEAEFTYNILRQVDLTEDRTAKYPFLVETIIAEHWLNKNEDEDQIRRATRGSRWEARSLGYTYASSIPSSTFRRVATGSTNPTVREYLVQKDPSVPTKTMLQLEIPSPEVTENELADIATVVAEFLGLPRLTITNMSTDDRWTYGEMQRPEQSELVS